MKTVPFTYIFIILSLTSVVIDGLAVMSVDLGSEWIKVGVISPGVPMEMALNKEAKRKTPNVISFRDNIRLFGEDAQVVGLRFPQNTYSYFLDLLGKNISHPVVKLYKGRFPYYDLTEDKERGSVSFKYDEHTSHSPEELIAQVLSKSKEIAEQSTRQVIKECVITVPVYFNQLERKLILQAAHMSNLKVLQLMNNNLAVALNYGIYRSKEFTENAQYVLFYDMGASATTATVVSYQTTKNKDQGSTETHPQITVMGVGFDRTLGGLEIQIRLRDYLAQKFNEMNVTKSNVFDNPKSMAKLFKEAGRVKNILSANNDHYAQIENLLDDKDFRYRVTRDDLENLLTDLLERIKKPIEIALSSSHLTKDVINQVVLFGAGTRVPKIQQVLEKFVGQTLAKNLNTDEAATMGAVYKAADLSTGFQVKKFILKDAVIYPIHIVFERDTEDGIKKVRRTLFGLMNPYPQKKIITFNKHTYDFSFNISYGDLEHLPKTEILNIGMLNLSSIQLTGISSAMNKYSDGNNEFKGIKVHFQLDESGILNVISAELVIEKSVADTEEGTFSKLGSTISKLFSSDQSQEGVQKEEEKPKTTSGNEKTEGDDKIREKPSNVTEKSNTTDDNISKEAKLKVVTVKEPIQASEQEFGIGNLNKKQLNKSIEKLLEFDKIDMELNRRANALNNLESFVIDTENKILEDEFIAASSVEERTKIQAACRETSDWLYDEGSNADTELYEVKLEKLKALTQDLYSRVWEHKERPEALKALYGMLNHSHNFMLSAKNLTKSANPDNPVFEDGEIDNLEKVIKDTEDWKNKVVIEQEKLQNYEKVKLTVKMITDKMSLLDREVKYLINKMKRWQPKNKIKQEPSEENGESEKNKEANEEEEPLSDQNEQESGDNQESDQHTEL